MENANVSQAFNVYDRRLTEEKIRLGFHRDFVGGMWEELGRLQLEFLKHQGLLPAHSLLDVGCGALRGGVRFVDYLNSGLYCGLDMNESLLEAGRYEVERAGLSEK
jgi:ubiquinone/menaquinone biosynthesis C-methylase UbiE